MDENKVVNQTMQLKIIPIILLSLILCSCHFFGNGKLQEQTKTLDMTYITWACDCANWATQDDLVKYSDNEGDSLADHCIYIEPARPSLELPDTLGYSNDLIRFTGQFYEKKGFPKGYQSFECPDKARVFRYTDYEVLVSHYHAYKDTLSEGIE